MFDENDLIYRYSRADAIRDGTLIDVSATAREAGIRFPTALTSAAWDLYVRVPQGVTGQDEAGRLWDVLWMLRYAILSGPRGNPIQFEFYVQNDDSGPQRVTLKSVAGPDDDGNPCVTIMLPDED